MMKHSDPMKHPHPRLFQQLLAGELNLPARVLLKIHLWRCDVCRQRLEAERRDWELLREFRQGLELMEATEDVAEHQTTLPKEPLRS